MIYICANESSMDNGSRYFESVLILWIVNVITGSLPFTSGI